MADSLFCAERPPPPGPAPDWAKGGIDWLYPHIASPDVHVEPDDERIRMYFHGLLPDGAQMTRVALSRDGLAFEAVPALLGPAYFRAFRYGKIGPTRWPTPTCSCARATVSPPSSRARRRWTRQSATRRFVCAATSCMSSGPASAMRPSGSFTPP